MRAFSQGELAATGVLVSHLELCLTCRSCERVCPSGVPYGRLIDNARAAIQPDRLLPRRRRWLNAVVRRISAARARQLQWLGALLRLYQVSGLQRFLRSSGALGLLGISEPDAELAPIPRRDTLRTFYPAEGPGRGEVALFTGCIAAITDRQTLHDAIRVLRKLGYNVRVPPDQVCCGALHQHGGDRETALKLARANVRAFAAEDTDAIVTTASACGAMLAEYASWIPGDATVASFSGKVVDVSEFLAREAWPARVALMPLDKLIAVHDPCTLTNVLHLQDRPYALLRRIPGARVTPLPDNQFCCGAAGTYHLMHEEMARALRSDKLERLARLAPDILVTSNVGCAMYLRAGVKEAGLHVEIVHPVTLVARQLSTIHNSI